MLKDIQEKLQDEKLKRLYSNEKDLMKDLTNYYFFGIFFQGSDIEIL